MVYALQRAGRRLRPGGTLVTIRPHRTRRPLVAIAAPRQRTPVVRLVNPTFQPYLEAAESALDRVVRGGWFSLIGVDSRQYRARLDNLSQLRTYIELQGPPRPRFPAGGRQRLLALWGSRPPGARIEVTEWMVVTALRRLAVDR